VTKRIDVLGVAGDVVGHVLAQVPVPASAPLVTRAASLHDDRYVAWWRDGSSDRSELADAPLISALLARVADGHLLQTLLAAFEEPGRLAGALRDEASFLATSPVGFDPHAQMTRDAVRRLSADARELLEIVWASIGLTWSFYAELWARTLRGPMADSCADVGGEIHELSAALPVVARETVRLSHPLGPHGRCFPEMIVVGAPARWNGLGPTDVAVRVAHESAVRCAGALLERTEWTEDGSTRRAASHWAVVEDLALRSVAVRLRGHRLHDAHARFVAGLDVAELRRADDALLAELLVRLDG